MRRPPAAPTHSLGTAGRAGRGCSAGHRRGDCARQAGRRTEAGRAPHTVVAAKLSATWDASWSDHNVELLLASGELPPGPLRLVSGVSEFIFANGATATIEGPALFEPLGPDRLSVQEGKVLCHCPDETSRLTVITPNSQVIDRGTVFGVAVESADRTRVAVIKGEVRFATRERYLVLKTGQAAVTNQAGHIDPDHFPLEQSSWLTARASQKIPDLSGLPNLLADPGFESVFRITTAAPRPSQPWLASLGHGDRVSDRGREGSSAARIQSLASPYWPWIGQDVKIEDLSGRIVVASVWAMHGSDDPLTRNQTAIVKIIFLAASGREFASAERHFLSADKPTDRYVREHVAAVAPSGRRRSAFPGSAQCLRSEYRDGLLR